MTFTTEGMVGVSLQLRTELPTHDPGTTIKGRDNTIWIYGQAVGAVPVGAVVVDGSFNITAGAGDYTADDIMANGEFGWVRQIATATGGGAGGLNNVVEDLTPQLGGFLDLNTNNIVASFAGGPRMDDANASATVPTLIPRRDGATSGIGASAAGEVSIITAGAENIRVSGALVTFNQSQQFGLANAPTILNENASGTNPTLIPDRAAPTTGIGGDSANDQIDLILAGSSAFRLSDAAALNTTFFSIAANQVGGPRMENSAASGTVPVFVPRNDALTTGIGANAAGEIDFIIAGTSAFFFNATGDLRRSASTNGPALMNVATSGVTPSVVPRFDDADTGIGQSSGDRLALIAGGLEGMGLREASSHVRLLSWLNTPITASTTQTQGQGLLLADYNDVQTVANPNDTVTLPPVSNSAVAGTFAERCFIVNNGVNTLQIFPTAGDDLGQGLNLPTTLAAGASTEFIAIANDTWVQIASGGISNVVEDTTPQLGGTLDMNGNNINAQTSSGPALLDEVASATNPTLIPGRNQGTTGIGVAATDTLHLIAQGTSMMQFDGDNQEIQINFDLDFQTATGPRIRDATPTATVPVLIPNQTSVNTGIGGTVGQVSLIGAGVEQITVNTTGVGFFAATPVGQSLAYTRNATVVEDRTLLASASATVTNNNNVLAALIADLQAIGILG